MPACKFWTAERDTTLRERWYRGDPVIGIAASFGVTKSAVIGRAHRLKFGGHGMNGAPMPERHFRWTPAKVETLKSMWTDGRSLAEIAKAIGASKPNIIASKAQYLKLEAHPASRVKRHWRKEQLSAMQSGLQTSSRTMDDEERRARIRLPTLTFLTHRFDWEMAP